MSEILLVLLVLFTVANAMDERAQIVVRLAAAAAGLTLVFPATLRILWALLFDEVSGWPVAELVRRFRNH